MAASKLAQRAHPAAKVHIGTPIPTLPCVLAWVHPRDSPWDPLPDLAGDFARIWSGIWPGFGRGFQNPCPWLANPTPH